MKELEKRVIENEKQTKNSTFYCIEPLEKLWEKLWGPIVLSTSVDPGFSMIGASHKTSSI